MYKNPILLIVLALSMMTLASCDNCRGLLGNNKVTCSNGGTCNDGTCDCLKGYYGPSCENTDTCELFDVRCERGECLNGECFCDSGYEGENCQIETREKFLGIYGVTESCLDLDTVGGYAIVISENILDGAVMNISNVFNYDNFPINGYFSSIEATTEPGTSSFKINNQRPDDGEKSINGSGYITVVDSFTTTITINYTTTNGNKSYDCTLQGTLIPQ